MKKQYLLIDNGHGLTIIDITDFVLSLSLALTFLGDEKAYMKWLHEKHNHEVWRIFALINTDQGKGKVKRLFHSLDEKAKNFITEEIENCEISFER